MPILNNIPRKKATPIIGKLWPTESLNAAGQHVPNGFEGLSYNSPFTETDVPPLATHFNTATQKQMPALKAQIPGVTVALHRFQRVPPTQTSTSFNTGKPRPIVNRTGGPSPTSDTPFHPVSHIKLPPVRVPVSVSGEKIPSHSSFFDTTGGNHLTAHAPNDPVNQSRWKTIKTGAANV